MSSTLDIRQAYVVVGLISWLVCTGDLPGNLLVYWVATEHRIPLMPSTITA
jgi:hypothetical protein